MRGLAARLRRCGDRTKFRRTAGASRSSGVAIAIAAPSAQWRHRPRFTAAESGAARSRPTRRNFRKGFMQKIEFSLNREFVQLNQLLKLTGLCDSGGAGKALVAGGTVSVDGNIERRKTCKIRVGQVVRLGDVEITVVTAEEASPA
jgi:ribosome-associated protein